MPAAVRRRPTGAHVRPRVLAVKWFTSRVTTSAASVFDFSAVAINGTPTELADHSEAVRGALVRGFDTWEALIADGLARMRATGELAAGADPETLAAGVMAALQGGLLLAQTRRDPRRLAIALDMALEHIPAARRPVPARR